MHTGRKILTKSVCHARLPGQLDGRYIRFLWDSAKACHAILLTNKEADRVSSVETELIDCIGLMPRDMLLEHKPLSYALLPKIKDFIHQKYHDKLSRCLEDVKRWLSTNKLKLNPDKTEFIVFGSKS